MSAPEYILLISDLAGEHRYPYTFIILYKRVVILNFFLPYNMYLIIFYSDIADPGCHSGSRIRTFPSRVEKIPDPGPNPDPIKELMYF